MSSAKKTYFAPSTALTAGALQDHLLHDLAIGDLSLNNPMKSYSHLKQKLRNDEKKRKVALRNVKPTVDTGRVRKVAAEPKKREKDQEREYVLDPLPKPSLAQKMGLVTQADKPLTNEEWSSVKQRSIARDDFKNPCAICQEFFKTEDQVLLSCSHVFHKACIQAFERFTGRKTCPMCRKIQYQARVVHDGTRVFKTKAAIRIQSFWRGYVVRKWYKKLRRTVPPNDPRLRRRFFEDKLKEITDRMVAMTSTETVDRFLQDIDDSIASSRAIFRHFEDSCLHRLSDEDWMEIEIKALGREEDDCPICLRSLHCENIPHGTDDNKRKKSAKITVKKHPSSHEPKSSKRTVGTSTKAKDCCKSPPTSPKKTYLALLSCSHLFHAKCLEALEDFYIMETPSDGALHHGISELPTMHRGLDFKCPVCRSLYIKRLL